MGREKEGEREGGGGGGGAGADRRTDRQSQRQRQREITHPKTTADTLYLPAFAHQSGIIVGAT